MAAPASAFAAGAAAVEYGESAGTYDAAAGSAAGTALAAGPSLPGSTSPDRPQGPAEPYVHEAWFGEVCFSCAIVADLVAEAANDDIVGQTFAAVAAVAVADVAVAGVADVDAEIGAEDAAAAADDVAAGVAAAAAVAAAAEGKQQTVAGQATGLQNCCHKSQLLPVQNSHTGKAPAGSEVMTEYPLIRLQ